MKRKILILLTLVAIVAALTVLLSGCSGSNDPTEGKYIVTFEINGGILNYGTSSTNGRINYAYYPGTYVKDPSEFPNYQIYRNGYIFTGWYTSEECAPGDKWDFSKTLDVEKLTLYAGWEVAINYTYSVNYVSGDETVALGSYKVSAGETFEDWRDFAGKRDGYTPNGFFSDPECTVPWNFSTAHPGGDADLDVPVYVNYIEGSWTLVNDFDQLKSALKNGESVYLMNDIDCGGGELYISGSYNNIFDGNGCKVTNFTVSSKGTTFVPTLAIFNKLASGADIRNVFLENAEYTLSVNTGIPANELTVKAAALAVNIDSGVTISNVSVSGTLKTNYEGELTCIEKVFYYTNIESEALLSGVTDFNADITVLNSIAYN